MVLEKRYLETRERNLELFSILDSDPNIHVLSVLELFSIFDSDPNMHLLSVLELFSLFDSDPNTHVLSVLSWRAVRPLPCGRLVTPPLALVTYPCRLVTPAGGICALAA